MNKLTLLTLLGFSLAIVGCDDQPNSDQVQKEQQEKILKEGVMSVGMPAIKNFREKKLLKDILELRDQEGLTTYVYIVAEQTGKLIFLGYGVGYGIPYATQYTNPQKTQYAGGGAGLHVTLPQADPNGLFSPASADGTWVLMKDPHGTSVKPVYIEPRCIVSPFPLQ
jgi:hypothetical protein